MDEILDEAKFYLNSAQFQYIPKYFSPYMFEAKATFFATMQGDRVQLWCGKAGPLKDII